MPRRISLTIVDDDITAIAELQDKEAPATCDFMWEVLKTPIVTKGIHAMWAGCEIMVEIPEENWRGDPVSVPQENSSLYPVPGDLMWAYFPEYAILGESGQVWDFIIMYGPDSIVDLAVGPWPGNVWARITENLPAFAEGCESLLMDGMKTYRISRLE